MDLEIAAHSLSGHIDGTRAEPGQPQLPPGTLDADQQAAHEAAVEAYEKDLLLWKAGEATIRKGLSEALPPTLYLTVRKETTAKAMWEAIQRHHQQKAQLIIVELQRKLQNEKCDEKGDLRAHLGKLRAMREDLAQMGEVETDDNFRTVILGSLPASYDTFIMSITNQTSPLSHVLMIEATIIAGTTIPARNVTVTPPKISPNDLIEIVGQEADRRALKAGNSKREEKDAAFIANHKSKGGQKGKSNVECYNCHKKGHMKADCWAKGGGKEGQGPKGKGPAKPSDSAAVADEDAAWMVQVSESDDEVLEDPFEGLFDCEEERVDLPDDLPALCTVSDSSTSDSDTESDTDTSDESDDKNSLYEWFRNRARGLLVTDDLGDAWTTYESAMIAHDCEHGPQPESELYDSGASRHMSPFRDRFINFVSIVPKPIAAANKVSFDAMGREDVWVDVPMPAEKSSRVLLKDVLYTPDIGVTLVSISRIAATGHQVHFVDSTMKIFNSAKKLVGEVQVKGGLYRVEHPVSAHAAMETVTVDELHRRMGHIVPDAARNLVKEGLVTGIALDESHAPSSCDSCTFAKMTRKAITKERVRPRAANFGDEIHSDVWGPAPVLTKGGNEYYVTFTDDHTRYTHGYLMKHKDEVFSCYKQYCAWMKTQRKAEIKALRSDRGGEYLSKEFSAYLQNLGTARRLTTHDTPSTTGLLSASTVLYLRKSE